MTPFTTRQAKARTRGYTVVELLMALAIFSIGVTGVVAMEKVTVSSNRHSRNLAIATRVAESWQERLAVDAVLWTQTSVNEGKTFWLKEINTAGTDGTWFLPVSDKAGAEQFGPGAGSLGEFRDHTLGTALDDIVFCTHVRLTRLMEHPNAGLIRVDVRTFWPKPGPRWDDGKKSFCTSNDVVDVGASERFHSVYLTSAIRQTPSI